jgi:hypothetical protein
MEGKIGDVKLEAPEGLPATLEQMKDTVMQLLQTNNPEILSAIGSPENMPILAEVIGLEDFTVPGQADREKQFEEIGLLLMSGAIPSPDPMTGQMTEVSSIQPELTVDNHQIEAEICRNWLVGEKGRQAKTDNPNGYKNILLHLQAHMQMMQQLQNPNPNPQQSQQPPQGNTVQPQGGNVIPMRPALQR